MKARRAWVLACRSWGDSQISRLPEHSQSEGLPLVGLAGMQMFFLLSPELKISEIFSRSEYKWVSCWARLLSKSARSCMNTRSRS
jgi:hypothetical protein